MKKHDYASSCMFYLGAIVVTLVCQGLAGVISAAVANSGTDLSGNAVFNTAFMVVIQVLMFAYIALYTKLLKRGLNFNIAAREGGKPDAAGFILPVVCAGVLMTGMYLPTLWYGYFTRYALRFPADYGNINVAGDTAATELIVIASVFLAPVCEETVYRGVLFNGLRTEMPVRRAALISAAAFVLMHMSAVQVVFQFALALVGAYTVYRSGRLLPSVILHASANALALVMQLTPFADRLLGAEQWLTSNVVAALFITLGLFAAAGAALYFIVRYGYGSAGAEENAGEESDNGDKQELSAMRVKDGTFRLVIGLGISAIVLIFNLVVAVV